ncbi:hypothetical protein RHMOL_Rhmol01G0171300 [Rhododendron molle]|uniref:Uncharacterized protein n=1 Tax=Rhododendron molle TaxID=49168 RepID=A0ACC0Q2W1_RHOML|nr:hypothetical protein RHMOL_Rhmol01G0171300 [Rhododendron molle]
MNYLEVIFESDCLTLINCFKDDKSACPWEIKTIVDDIKIGAQLRKWSFIWCNMEKNRVAHGLVKFCSGMNFFFQTGCIPLDMVVLIADDVKRL